MKPNNNQIEKAFNNPKLASRMYSISIYLTEFEKNIYSDACTQKISDMRNIICIQSYFGGGVVLFDLGVGIIVFFF